MGNEISLQVKTREVGKSSSRSLRSNERTPGIIYGKSIENIALSIEQKMVDKYQKVLKENPIFLLNSEDKRLDGVRALIKNIVYHPVNRKPVHIDFFAIASDDTIVVEVEVVLTGTPKGVKTDGGNLSVNAHKIEIECLPHNIPSKIEHDISDLGLDESVHVADLKAPEGVEILTSKDVTICTIHIVKEEEEKPAVEAAATDAATADAANAPTKTEEKK